jgi:hypothetical protein
MNCCGGNRLNTQGTTPDQKKEILKYASEIRKFEIERFWGRSIFFWGFIAAAFVAYVAVYKSGGPGTEGQLPFFIACFGLVSSVAWTLQNRGSKYWQEAWEQKVESVESDVLGTNLFSNQEPLQKKNIWGAARFSVSRLTIALSDFTVLAWVVLAARVTHVTNDVGAVDWWILGPLIGTANFILFLFAFGRSRN